MQTTNEDKQQKLLEIKHLKKYFPLQTNLLGKPKAHLRAVDDVSFDLMAGKTIGIVGESGCGKTTLGRTILKLYDLTGGKVIYHGQSIDDFLPKYYYKCIRYLPYYKWRFNRLKKSILKILQENESFSKQNEIINLIKKVESNSFQFDEIKEIFLEIELDISEQEKSLLKKINKKMVNLMQLLENCAATTGGVILSEEVKSISKELILKLRKEKKLRKLQQLKNEYDSKSKAQSKDYQEKLSDLENQITQVVEIIKASSDNLKAFKNQIQDTELFQYLEGKREKGLDLNKLSTKEMRSLRQEIQLIFQDPYSSLPPRMTIGAIISEAVRVHKIVPKNEINDYVRDVMKKCGLQSQFYDRYPHEFSGGQRQRICIARALAVKPKLVICDEPVSALDVSIQAQIINLLKDLQRELGLTYVFISHDLSVVKYITDDILVMYLGNMMEKGDTKAIFQKPLHPYTQALFSAVPVPNPDEKMNRIILKGDIPSPANPPKGCKFHTRCVHCMSICKLQTPLFTEIEHNHYVACHLYNQNAMANQEFYDKQLEEVQLKEEKPKEEHIASIKKIWNRLIKKKNE